MTAERFGNYERLIEDVRHVYPQPAILVEPEPVVRHDGSTLFTTSGIQRLYDVVLRGADVPTDPLFVEQPVIRMNYKHDVTPSSFTSFVNPGLFKVGATEQEHAEGLERLTSLIQSFSGNRAGVTTTEEEATSRWSEEVEFGVNVTHISVDGLEVADAIFAPVVPVSASKPLAISEFGLGKERLMHGIPGHDILETIFQDPITPETARAYDAIRTMALIAGAGVLPANKNHGYQLRWLSKLLVSEGMPSGEPLSGLVERSYEYWEKHVNMVQDLAATSRVITHEYERNLGAKIIRDIVGEAPLPKVDTNRGIERTVSQLSRAGITADDISSKLPGRYEIIERNPKQTLIVCDYDNEAERYTFPNFHLGSSENRIWHFAKSATELPGLRVVITGPRWLPEYVPGAIHFPSRLDASSAPNFLAQFGKADFLFGGHEYFDKPDWTEPFSTCADNLISYQLHPYEYRRKSFNGRDKFLFCYSDEMLATYAAQSPLKALLFHSGVDEETRFDANPEDRLVWMGRLDAEKAPHIAIAAARLLNKKITMMGETVRDQEYGEWLQPLLAEPHVEAPGILRGDIKMRTIAAARCGVYTVASTFAEAGAGVLGEYLASGVPIAGISWRGNDAVCEAVNEKPEYGKIVDASRCRDEDEIARKLSFAIQHCYEIDRQQTYTSGHARYNATNLVKQMLETVMSRSSVSKPL